MIVDSPDELVDGSGSGSVVVIENVGAVGRKIVADETSSVFG